jgi:hypothetical protein
MSLLGPSSIPEHLSDDARGCIEVIQAHMPPNIYSALDSFILSAFGTAWAIHKKATLVISDPNFVWIDKSKRGAGVESAWIRIARQQAALMASLGDRLGLDPFMIPMDRLQHSHPGEDHRPIAEVSRLHELKQFSNPRVLREGGQ